MSVSESAKLVVKAAAWRLRWLLNLRHLRFHGAYSTVAEAAAAAHRRGIPVGYNNDLVVLRDYELMCELKLEDYPVLFWLLRLEPEIHRLLDAGGHMATKYQAFRKYLTSIENIDWVIYDVPAVVKAGRQRIGNDGLKMVRFIDALAESPEVDVLLASGLFQFLDLPIAEFLSQLPNRPQHLLINKVQTRDGPEVVTLEDFGCAEVPYQIRNRKEFVTSWTLLGYDIIDEWTIPSLSHVIPTHPHLGSSVSRGYYLRLRTPVRLDAGTLS
jgi:putative methyltransferase (TIGR04325 family)